jgi:hypothetical protein
VRGVWSLKSASSVWEKEKAGFLLGLPLQVLPLHHLTALGASVSVRSLLSATPTEDIQFDTGSWPQGESSIKSTKAIFKTTSSFLTRGLRTNHTHTHTHTHTHSCSTPPADQLTSPIVVTPSAHSVKKTICFSLSPTSPGVSQVDQGATADQRHPR